MKRLLVFVLLLAVAAAAIGYWRGWLILTKDGKVNVQVDPVKFKLDREAFSKSVGAKATAMKNQVASLWEKSEGLTGDEKAVVQKELGELKQKHDRLEQQIKELNDAGHEKFESIKQDLAKTLEEVEKKTEELTKKLEKGKEK